MYIQYKHGEGVEGVMTHEEKIAWMALWAAKNGCQLQLQGECGFGRECVGILIEGIYPDYFWYDKEYNRVDANGEVWYPKDAYHKHECVAVLGRGQEAEEQLYNWLRWFDDNGFKPESSDADPAEYANLGAIAFVLGKHRHHRMVRQ